MEQFTKPGLAFSGANDVLLRIIRKSQSVSLSPSDRSTYYFRSSKKSAPHNQLLKLAAMMATETKVGAVKDIGLLFNSTPATGGLGTKTFSASWASAKVSGKWNGKSWTIAFDGKTHKDAKNGRLLTPKTVVLQFVERKTTKFGDKFGGKTPLLKSVGSGRAIILRNGQSFESTWSRPTDSSGTKFSFNGTQMPFDVGQVMIVFIDGTLTKAPIKLK